MLKFLLISSIFLISSSQILNINYTYASHGQDWDRSICLTGKQQSPINISNFTVIQYPNLHYFFAKYHESATILANYTNISLFLSSTDPIYGLGSLLTVLPDSKGSKKEFIAQDIIFRAPAEHIINGERMPLEVQIYHRVNIFIKK